MHLTRPKSSKGRSRPAVNSLLTGGDTDSIQPDRPPESPGCSRPDRNLRSRSQPIMWQSSSSQLSRDEVLHMLQHAPAAPPQSLNKYRVLPSIERRQSEVNLHTNMSVLSLADDDAADGHPRVRPKPPEAPAATTTTTTTTEAGASGSLLLAIRAPCGRRFEQHFDPTDTLLAVRGSAETRYGARYGEAFIETMDVPRRTFTDLDMTLAQCGILNRSVLCISQSNDSVLEHD